MRRLFCIACYHAYMALPWAVARRPAVWRRLLPYAGEYAFAPEPDEARAENTNPPS